MPLPDLNLGSRNAFTSAASSGEESGMAGIENVSQAQSAVSMPARIAPPPEYAPGPTSMAQPEEGVGEKVANFFLDLTTASGDIPISQKLRMAKADALLNKAKQDLAEKNYNLTQQTAQRVAEEHNVNMKFKMFEMMTSVKGHLSMLEPAERKTGAEWYAKALNSMVPGSGDIAVLMHEKPHVVLGLDQAAKQPSKVGSMLRELIDKRGYTEVAKDPHIQAVVDQQSRDMFPLMANKFTEPDRKKLISGTMSESEFRAAFSNASLDESNTPKPEDVAYAQHVLEAPWAQGLMAQMGVKLDSSALKMQQKKKPAGEETLGGIKAQEYRKEEAKLNEMLEFNTKHPDSVSAEKIAAQKKLLAIKLGDDSKDQGVNPNNMVNQRLQILSKGKVTDVDSIATMAPKEQAQAYAWAEQARKEQDQASGMGSLNAKMSTPGDTSQYVMADELKTHGRIIPVRESVNEGELRTNKKYLKTTPEQRKEIRELNVITESSRQIFKSAGEAFDPPHSSIGMAAAEVAILADDTNPLATGPKLLAKAAYPKLTDYIARRESTLGKFARAISGEVGVLTDQDAGRVRNIFPNATDAASTRKSKERAFSALLELNKRFAAEVLAGEMSPDESAILKATPKYRDAANGILGSAEGVGKSQEAPARGESLLEQMRKGK